MVVFLHLLLATILVSSAQSSGPESQCSSLTKPPAVKIVLTSQRNSSGHWLSQFDVERGGDRKRPSDKMELSPWSVGMEQSSVACGGIESSLIVRIQITGPPPIPSPGYELFPGLGYYKFHTLVTNWDRARQMCAEEGAHLMIINSEKEAEVAKTLYARFPKITNKWAWVGVCEEGKEQYRTVFGDTLDSTGFARWVPSQPNDGNTDDCLVVHKENGGLEDTPRGGGFPFICEQQIFA